MGSAPPLRIVILGCMGAGKSMLAREVGARLGLPIVHLDALFHGPGWIPLPHDLVGERLRQAMARPGWVIEGIQREFLAERLRAATTAVYLDYPTRVCLSGLAMRWMQTGSPETRDSEPPHPPERVTLFDLRVVRAFRGFQRPIFLREMECARDHCDVRIFRSRAETAEWLDALVEQHAGKPRGVLDAAG